MKLDVHRENPSTKREQKERQSVQNYSLLARGKNEKGKKLRQKEEARF